MTTTSETTRDPGRLTAAIWLVLRRYSAQLRKQPALTAGAIILPAMGDIFTYYAPPLVIAQEVSSAGSSSEEKTLRWALI